MRQLLMIFTPVCAAPVSMCAKYSILLLPLLLLLRLDLVQLRNILYLFVGGTTGVLLWKM
jgi:hypothetical protein